MLTLSGLCGPDKETMMRSVLRGRKLMILALVAAAVFSR